MRTHRCHDCLVAEGEIHDLGCDMERCPFCGHQIISCMCVYKKLDIPCEEGDPAYENGLTDEQHDQWLALLNAEGRVPYIIYPNLCRRCGALWPEMFNMPDDEWQQFIQVDVRSEMLCLQCYTDIRGMIVGAEGRAAMLIRDASPVATGEKGWSK